MLGEAKLELAEELAACDLAEAPRKSKRNRTWKALTGKVWADRHQTVKNRIEQLRIDEQALQNTEAARLSRRQDMIRQQSQIVHTLHTQHIA